MRRDSEPRGLTGETGVVIVSVGSALGDLAGSAMLAIGLTPHERFVRGSWTQRQELKCLCLRVACNICTTAF